MRDDVRRDWDWADQYWPQQRAIILHHLTLLASDVRQASPEEDLQRGVDAVIYTSRGSVALRTRRPGVWQRDFTIRSRRAGGIKTELDKWNEGIHPDWYLLGWARDSSFMDDWILIDVLKFIDSGLLTQADEMRNVDGRTWFKAVPAFRIDWAGCAVARAPREQGKRDPGESKPSTPQGKLFT